jgi:cellulose 1,4-beta-cellobiosidase
VGVAGYHVYRGGVRIGSTSTPGYTDTTVSPGQTSSYTVDAYDGSGNVSAQSAPLTVTTPAAGSQPPTPPTNLTATTAAKGHSVGLRWAASTDDVAVAGYRVSRNGTVIATVTGTAYTDSPGKGTWTYDVVAYDGAGLTSTASNTVSVKF